MSDWSDGIDDLPNDYGSVDALLAPYVNDPQAQAFGVADVQPIIQQALGGSYDVSSGGALFPGESADVGRPAESAKTDSSSISKWWGGLSSDDKKLGLTMATLLAGGLSNIGTGKRKDKELSIQQQNADTNLAAVNERKRQFDTQMANGSAIANTNFGSAMGPGMINAPVTLTRKRSLGVPA